MKRDLLIALVLGLTWLFASLAFLNAAENPAPRKPNIIFILADDLGYGDLGCYGQKKTQTPSLDRMASEGMRFTQFYAGATVCAPSRSSLLTGLHTGHTPVRALPYHAYPPVKAGDAPLPEGIPTLANIAQSAGYRTACIGKWGLGATGSSGDVNKQGFDESYGYVGHGEAHNYYPAFLWRNGTKELLQGKPYSHDLFTQEALHFIEADQKGPFFLYLPYTIPHFNMEVPSTDPYTDKDWSPIAKNRAAMISRMDRDIGQILEKLKALGLDRNTLVIFSSDNGPTPENNTPIDFFDAAGGLRGTKRDLYEGGIREPLIAWWSGIVPAGTVSDYVGAFCDILPTLANVEGVPVPPNLDGISFLNALKGHGDKQEKHAALYWETVEREGAQAVRMGQWKGVLLRVSSARVSPWELYDLSVDPQEQKNVAAQHPDVVKEMEAIVKVQHVPSETFPLLYLERQPLGLKPEGVRN